jgi:hypothetical protein
MILIFMSIFKPLSRLRFRLQLAINRTSRPVAAKGASGRTRWDGCTCYDPSRTRGQACDGHSLIGWPGGREAVWACLWPLVSLPCAEGSRHCAEGLALGFVG